MCKNVMQDRFPALQHLVGAQKGTGMKWKCKGMRLQLCALQPKLPDQ